jgi:hypothetical protein
MLEVIDYSNRRGVVSQLLDKVYALLNENAQKHKLSNLPPPGNKILWKQNYKKLLVDVSRRWVFAMDGKNIAGFIFYRYGEDKRIFIEEFIISWQYMGNNNVFTMLMDKFMRDNLVKSCSEVMAGQHIRIEHDKELLASVGFKEEYADGYQSLGGPAKASGALAIRYGHAQ